MTEIISFSNSLFRNGIQAGSPATVLVFPTPALGFMVDNTSGTAPLWVSINSNAVSATNGSCYVVYPGTFRSFGMAAGSVNLMASGASAGSALYNIVAGW